MANEQQYYNPIIQAMIASAQQQHANAQLEVEKQRNKEEAGARKESLKNETERIKNEHEHQLAVTELAGKAHSLAQEAQHIQTIAALNDLASKGVDVKKLGISGLFNTGGIQTANPNEQLNTPPHVAPQSATPLQGVQEQTPLPLASQIQGAQPQQAPDISSAFPTPEQNQQRLIGLETARTKAQLDTEEPYKIAEGARAYARQAGLQKTENDFKERLQESENKFKSSITDRELASREGIAKLERNTQVAINNATNAMHLKLGGMADPEILKSMVVAGLTGQTKLNRANPIERLAATTIDGMGGRDLDPKEAQALKESQALVPLFDKLKTFADKLPSGGTGAFLQGKGLALKNWAGWSSDQQNELNIIKSQALNIGKAVEGMTGGRMNIKQLELDLNSLASGGITKQQATDRIDNLKDLYLNKQENVLMGGMPEFQKDLIRTKYGINKGEPERPDWLRLAPKTNKSGHSLDEKESLRVGHPLYK